MYKWNEMKRKIENQGKLIKILQELLEISNAPRVQEGFMCGFCGLLLGGILGVVIVLLF